MNKVWRNRIDNKYDIFVESKAPYKGDLVIQENKIELLREEVNISFDAKFGPDIEDVYKWEDRAIEFIDNQLKKK